MFEIIMAIAAAVAMARIASAENKSSLIWGLITFGLVVVCIMFIPWPFIRVGIAFAVAFGGMMVYKIVANE